jgi:hypothetical protein
MGICLKEDAMGILIVCLKMVEESQFLASSGMEYP